MNGRTIGPDWSGPVRGPDFWSEILFGPVRGLDFGPKFTWSGTWSGIRSKNPLRGG